MEARFMLMQKNQNVYQVVTARLNNAPQSAGLPGLAGLAISKKENYYYFNNKSASPTSPAASWPHISCLEFLHVPTHGQLLTVSAMRFPACLLGRLYFCEHAMMCVWEWWKRVTTFVHARSSEIAYLRVRTRGRAS